MNKDNQHDDLDGLHSKPPPIDLPPLWDDIAGALDENEALESTPQELEETDAQHEVEVADFAVIKAGFVATYSTAEPPKFLWDTIEQDLEAQVQTDAPTDFSRIKEGFLATFEQQQPPQSFWKELVERVDQPVEESPQEEPAQYSHIKKSFERKYSAIVVPLFSWEDLVARMETENILADTPDRFSCIKESFETVYAQQVPSAATEKALWERLYPMAAWLIATQKLGHTLWQQRAAVVVLVLLGLGGWITEHGENATPSRDVFSGEPVELQASAEQTTATPENGAIAMAPNQYGDGSKTTNPKISQNGAIAMAPNRDVFSGELQRSTNQKPLNTINNNPIPKSNDLINKQPTATDYTALLIQQQKNYSSNYIPDPAIARLQKEHFTEVRPATRGKKMHFELGVEGRLGTSVLLQGKETGTSPRETMLCPTGAVGVNFQYYFSKDDALIAGAYPYSSTIQCWGKTAQDGTYEELAMNLSFVDFTLGYQRILLRYNGLEEAPARVYARLNVGMGYLTQSTTRLNQRLIHTPKLFQHINWSAGLAIGNLHQMQRFVLDYGLMGNVGINQFVTAEQPQVLAPARIVNVGAYVGLRYLLVPRKAPSKKQRQFDWSAPFYIEEPQF